MESFYPEDLRNELYPLVFVVSAINDADDHENGGKPIFNRFVAAISSSLTVTSDSSSTVGTSFDCDDAAVGTSRSNISTQSKQMASRNVSLFRADDDDDDDNSSDEDDELLLESFVNGPIRKKSGHGFGFGRRNTGRNATVVDPNYSFDPFHYIAPVNTSFARTLKTGKSFFQHARIVNISTRYGFPPSKDPEGTQNLAFDLSNTLKQPLRRSGGSVAVTAAIAEREQALHALFRTYPMAGIIPTGWLAKHVHALPSAIMVVCTITSSQKEQAEQDRRLFETIEHLQYSIVPKRQCGIQVVGLMKDDVSDEQGAEWSRSVSQDLLLEDNLTTPFTVTLLRINATLNENESSKDSKEALQKLHGAVRDASLQYYRQQARRTKDKLRRLTDDLRKNGPPAIQLSPLIIRYCFKIAIFYEFQMCYEKSLRFLMEAYRSVTKYYLWLMETKISNQTTQPTDSVGKFSDAKVVSLSLSSPTLERHAISALPVSATNIESGEVVEVELAPDTIERGYSSFIPPPPDDVTHQCREVADWLNFKLLYISLSSNTEAGLAAAGGHWRQHSRIFSSLQHTSKLPNAENWFVWSYISRQRIVMSLLTEKYPQNVTGELSHHVNEALIRCSPWRCYMSAAEATLALAQEVEKVKEYKSLTAQTGIGDKGDTSGSRARYVGSLHSDSMRLGLLVECTVAHREKALDLILRSIRLFEDELMNNKRGFYAEDLSIERTSSRSGARLYYLAGGVLIGMGKHKDAGLHLMKASRFCRGWQDLELPVRRLLTECYEHCIPSQIDNTSNESSENVVSTILYSYFNAELSSQNLRNALNHLSSVSGGKTLQWYLETCDEEDTSLPFSFAVSFPGKTQARSGDTVAASVTVKSNLNYAVYVNSVAIGTLAGKLVIPPNDLLSAANASDGSDGGIIIQANAAIVIMTKVKLPKDLSAIAFDESGNGGELLGVAGKGSFAKIAKPRTAGITAAGTSVICLFLTVYPQKLILTRNFLRLGGARLVSEQLLQRGNNESQGWNVRFLGGKPLLCDGLHLTFYPVQAEAASSSTLTPIELSIQKRKIKTAANIKRTPFEEENYIASAWSRPQHLPFSRGPRSIRVLGPQPELIVTNMTEEATKGKALEGTVNRLLLKLQSGPEENCTDLKINISCFSVLITPNGTTQRLVSCDEILRGSENSLDMSNSNYRTPSLVKSSNEVTSSQTNGSGYNLPVGWALAGTGQQYSDKCDDLKAGEYNYVQLDVYRPAAYSQKTLLFDDGNNNEDNIGDVSLCKTDFYVSVEYKQERLSKEKQNQRRPKRTTRARPVMSSASRDNTTIAEDDQTIDQKESPENTDTYDIVALEWSGAILWAPPITATFSRGAQSGYPCGSRHPSQQVDSTNSSRSKEADFLLVDGEKFSTRCSLQLDTSMDSINTEIVAVRFEV